MTLELNILDIAKQPSEEKELREVHSIESMAQEHMNTTLFGDSLEICLVKSTSSEFEYIIEEDCLTLARELELVSI